MERQMVTRIDKSSESIDLDGLSLDSCVEELTRKFAELKELYPEGEDFKLDIGAYESWGDSFSYRVSCKTLETDEEYNKRLEQTQARLDHERKEYERLHKKFGK